jgi:predicted phosphoadenosine phosphosulfate sulfurtransferase
MKDLKFPKVNVPSMLMMNLHIIKSRYCTTYLSFSLERNNTEGVAPPK